MPQYTDRIFVKEETVFGTDDNTYARVAEPVLLHGREPNPGDVTFKITVTLGGEQLMMACCRHDQAVAIDWNVVVAAATCEDPTVNGVAKILLEARNAGRP